MIQSKYIFFISGFISISGWQQTQIAMVETLNFWVQVANPTWCQLMTEPPLDWYLKGTTEMQ